MWVGGGRGGGEGLVKVGILLGMRHGREKILRLTGHDPYHGLQESFGYNILFSFRSRLFED